MDLNMFTQIQHKYYPLPETKSLPLKNRRQMSQKGKSIFQLVGGFVSTREFQ